MNFTMEDFIDEVKSKPAIYDISLPEYADRAYKKLLWTEVCQKFTLDWDKLDEESKEAVGKEMKNRWKSIRDAFVREVRYMREAETNGEPQMKKRKYIYYDNLTFLLPTVGARSMRGHNSTSSVCNGGHTVFDDGSLLPHSKDDEVNYNYEQEGNGEEENNNHEKILGLKRSKRGRKSNRFKDELLIIKQEKQYEDELQQELIVQKQIEKELIQQKLNQKQEDHEKLEKQKNKQQNKITNGNIGLVLKRKFVTENEDGRIKSEEFIVKNDELNEDDEVDDGEVRLQVTPSIEDILPVEHHVIQPDLMVGNNSVYDSNSIDGAFRPDPDYMFLMSLIPSFKKLGEEKKSYVKIEISSLIHESLYGSKTNRFN